MTTSNIETIENISITDLSSINSINVDVSYSGDYEYSIDVIKYQSSSMLYNVELGIYTVNVIDKNRYGIAQEDIMYS